MAGGQMMELKIRSFSYEFNGIRIKFMLEDLAAKSKDITWTRGLIAAGKLPWTAR